MRFFLVFFSFLLCACNSLLADDFLLRITGASVDSLSALDIKLAIEPKKYCELEKEITVNRQTFFKNVDSLGSLINVSFRTSTANLLNTRSVSAVIKSADSNVIEIRGKIKRLNYTGKISPKILGIEYIADFAKEVDGKQLISTIGIIKEDDILPFFGITKARILGPNPRIYSKTMLVSVGEIEAYGFNLEKNITNIKINNQKADLINKKIIIANISIPELPDNNKLPIILSLNVAGKEVKKNVGSIDLIESVDLR